MPRRNNWVTDGRTRCQSHNYWKTKYVYPSNSVIIIWKAAAISRSHESLEEIGGSWSCLYFATVLYCLLMASLLPPSCHVLVFSQMHESPTTTRELTFRQEAFSSFTDRAGNRNVFTLSLNPHSAVPLIVRDLRHPNIGQQEWNSEFPFGKMAKQPFFRQASYFTKNDCKSNRIHEKSFSLHRKLFPRLKFKHASAVLTHKRKWKDWTR